jgi:hypothetical protein
VRTKPSKEFDWQPNDHFHRFFLFRSKFKEFLKLVDLVDICHLLQTKISNKKKNTTNEDDEK